jgi:hypothetical protein
MVSSYLDKGNRWRTSEEILEESAEPHNRLAPSGPERLARSRFGA